MVTSEGWLDNYAVDGYPNVRLYVCGSWVTDREHFGGTDEYAVLKLSLHLPWLV